MTYEEVKTKFVTPLSTVDKDGFFEKRIKLVDPRPEIFIEKLAVKDGVSAEKPAVDNHNDVSGENKPGFRLHNSMDEIRIPAEDNIPVDVNHKPVIHYVKPLVETHKPVNNRLPVINNNSKQGVDNRKSEDIHKPVVDVRKPVVENSKPVDDNRKSVVDNHNPVGDNCKPAVDNRLTVEDKLKSVLQINNDENKPQVKFESKKKLVVDNNKKEFRTILKNRNVRR